MKINARWLLGTTALYLLPVVAVAADLPVRGTAPAPAALATRAYDWTGFYLGAQVGNQQLRAKTEIRSATSSSFFGGLHAGYNKQLDSLVIGVEGDLEYVATAKAISQVGENGPDWQGNLIQGSARARLGYAFDNALLYATGGIAFMSTQHGSSSTLTGWTLGGGLEYALSKQWSARVEYRYSDFGKWHNVQSITSQAVRVGLSYRFPQ